MLVPVKINIIMEDDAYIITDATFKNNDNSGLIFIEPDYIFGMFNIVDIAGDFSFYEVRQIIKLLDYLFN